MPDSLEAIYAEVPKLDCRRKCQGSCGPLLVPKIEMNRIHATGAFVPLGSLEQVTLNSMWSWMGKEKLAAMHPDENFTCRLLYPISGKCRVYEVRPLICRIWGTMKRMSCPYGCIPSRWLTEAEVHRLFERVLALQGETS